jgi:uncharacterized protein YlxW (UPF0749 family)
VELREQLANATLDCHKEEAIRKDYEKKLQKQNDSAEQARKLLEADVKRLKEEVEKLKKKTGGRARQGPSKTFRNEPGSSVFS